MNNSNMGKVMIIFLTITIFSLFCADRSQSFLSRSGSGYSGQSQSPNQSSIFSISPGSLGETIYNGMASLTRTVENLTSDEKVFLLLGWPTTSLQAREEMRRNREIYEQVFSSEINPQKRQEFLQTIVNRTCYLLRVYNALPNRSDGVPFAEHCIKHHATAMPEPLKIAFTAYLEKKAQESYRAIGNAHKHLHQQTGSQFSKTDSTSATGKNGDLHNTIDGNNITTILLKIGWPSEGNKTQAEAYLEKCLNAYKIKKASCTTEGRRSLQTPEGIAGLGITATKATEKMINNLQARESFIALREEWMRKIYKLLPQRLDGVKLAWFCLNSHKYVIPTSLKDNLRAFIQEQQQEYADIFNQLESSSGHNN